MKWDEYLFSNLIFITAIILYPLETITISKRILTVYKGEKIMVVSSYYWKRGNEHYFIMPFFTIRKKATHVRVVLVLFFFRNHPIPICIIVLKPANIMIACIRVPKSMRAVFYPKTCLGFVAPLKRKKFLWLLLSKTRSTSKISKIQVRGSYIVGYYIRIPCQYRWMVDNI